MITQPATHQLVLWSILAALIAGAVIMRLLSKTKQSRKKNLKNEKRWQFALEGSGDGVWDWEAQSNEIFFSERYKEILGFADHELGNSLLEWSSRLHPDDYQRVSESLDKIVHGETQTCALEHRIRCKNGEYRWILTRGKVIHQTAEGKPGRITGTITDMTEHRLMEDQVFKLQRLESMAVLAGGIAHDFNNILTASIGYTSLARIYLDAPSKALKALEAAEKAQHRAAELTRQLLTFAKGGLPHKQSISAANLIHESLSLALRGTKVKGDYSIPESIYVEADEEQLNQAFRNIILNAAQSMQDGGEVSIRAENRTLKENNIHELPAGPYLTLSFSDQGCGIPSEHLSRIFDPFFSTKSGCTGIGLSTAHSIIRNHGGAIEVQSSMDSGTTFVVYLPSSEKVCAKVPSKDKITYNERTPKEHILIMDDEEMIRNLSSELLEVLGYQAFTCTNGEDAVEIYKTALKAELPFSVVIMDLTIPGGMGGKEAAQSILAFDPNAKLIVSSGYSNDPVMANYEKYGFIAAVSKPYSVDKIASTLDLVFSRERTGNC